MPWSWSASPATPSVSTPSSRAASAWLRAWPLSRSTCPLPIPSAAGCSTPASRSRPPASSRPAGATSEPAVVLLAKLRSDVTRVVETARAVVDAGADAVVVGNALPAVHAGRSAGRAERSGHPPAGTPMRGRGGPGAARHTGHRVRRHHGRRRRPRPPRRRRPRGADRHRALPRPDHGVPDRPRARHRHRTDPQERTDDHLRSQAPRRDARPRPALCRHRPPRGSAARVGARRRRGRARAVRA